MRYKTRRLLAVGAVLAIVASGGAAFAAGSSQAGAKSSGPGLVGAVTSYLGISAGQLRVDLAAGKTLAQIATAHGKTVAGLEHAITWAVKTRLDKAVAAGYLKVSTEQKVLARLSDRLDQLVDKSFAH